jgi:hypothetical protein
MAQLVAVKQPPAHGEITMRLRDFGTTYVGQQNQGFKAAPELSNLVAVTISYKAAKGYVGTDTFTIHYPGDHPGGPGSDTVELVNVIP